jgi:hypothetical protein
MLRRRIQLPAAEPGAPPPVAEPESTRIAIDPSRGLLILRFAGDYPIELKRIHTERDLLAWTMHLAGKDWMSRERLAAFIEAVAKYKGFKVHGL